MDNPITVGIIGFGLIGRTHAQALLDVDGAVLTSVVSRRTREQLTDDAPASLDGVVVHDSPEAMYAAGAPDVVAICSPSSMHGDQARAALDHGAHVLVEKPPAGSSAELHALATQAAAGGRQLAVVSQHRMATHTRHIVDVLATGALGAPRLGEVRLHWHRPQSYYDASPWRKADPHAGSLANQGWHAVDLLTWFFGPAAQVVAQAATLAHDIDVEDTTAATVRFHNGAIGSIVTSTATPPGEPAEIRLFFENGSIRLQDTEIVEWATPDQVLPPPSGSGATTGATDPAAIGAGGHREQWQDLVAAIRAGTRPAVTASDSVHTLELVEAIYRAAKSGAATTVGGGRS